MLRLTGPLSYSGTTNISAGTLDFAPNSGTSTLAGSVIGSGTSLKSGNGTTIIGGTGNTFTGPLSITAGTLQIGTATTSNISTQALGVTSAVTVGSGANLVFKNSSAIVNAASILISGTIATDAAGVVGGGFVNKLGNGPITMSGGAIVANTGGNASNFQSYALGGDVAVTGSSASTISVDAGALADQAGVHLTWSTGTGTTRTFTVTDVTGDAAADLIVSARLINSASTLAATNLAKAGLGTMLLSGSNGYTGSTAIDSGTLAFSTVNALRNTSGVSVAGGAALRYSGAAATLDRNISVTSGTGSLVNEGSGPLTLSGTLTKDGTVLRLTGGSFNVTGRIVGASANSDLLVDGTSTVTLSTTNSYNGPTFVNQASNLIVGVNNAIPSNSVVTLGDATTTGTLTLGSNSNAIGGLAFGAGGGTLRLTASGTGATAQLTAAGGTMNLAGGTLDLAGSGTSAGYYRLLSAQSVTNSFASITGTSAAYQVLTTSTSVDYQQRAVLGAVTVSSPTAAIITGGSAAFTYSVANNALLGGASLAVTGTGLSNVIGTSSGSAAAAGSTGSLSGLVFNGTTIGSNQQGTFTVDAPAAYGSTSTTGTVSVTVLDHALPGFVGSGIADPYAQTVLSLDFGSVDEAAGVQSLTYSLTNLASLAYGAGLTAGLDLTGFTASGDGFASGLSTFNNLIAGGTSSLFTATFTPSAQGTFSKTFTLSFSDNSGLSGAAARRDLTINAQVVVVPEPGAMSLAAIGTGLTAWIAWRRRRGLSCTRR
jgi:autotransporter-associated beta strand protein